MKAKQWLSLLVFLFALLRGEAQLLVNEYCHRNVHVIQDEFGKNSDWIELFNNNPTPLDISNYAISDHSSSSNKWYFPDVLLGAKERILVFASGRDKRYATHHWETAIFSHDVWKYHLPAEETPADWKTLIFDDTNWLTGVGGIGCGDGDDGTTVAPVNAIFLRKKFTIVDSTAIAEAVLHADYDDAFVAYLNGVEIARSMIGAVGEPTPFNALPNGQHEASIYRGMTAEPFFIGNEKLSGLIKQGENVLCVQVHNSFASNDISSNFFLSFGVNTAQTYFSTVPNWFQLRGSSYHTNFKLATDEVICLFDNNGTLVDSHRVASLSINNSEGRSRDGSGTWCVFSIASPNAANQQAFCFSGYESAPKVSQDAGFYHGPQTITATAGNHAQIRYTTNGNEPTELDSLYSGPLAIETTTVVSFKAFSTTGRLPSETVRRTYFIDEDNFNLPVISISTDEASLWSDSAGIYTSGTNAGVSYPFFGANFWQKWERLSHLEFFDAYQEKQFEVDFGLKIHGNWSRGQQQKGLRIDLDHKYGFPTVNYPLIPDKPQLTQYRAFNLRNGGNDFYGSRFRDALMQRNMKFTHVDYMAYAPAIVFLNGHFWGLYEMREKMDQHYLRFNHGANPDALDLISYDHNLGFQVHNGSDSAFYEMLYRITSLNPADDALFYETVQHYLDIENYTDYFATEIFYANSDWMGEWTNNIKCWKEKKAGSKWRYMLWDLDYGCGFVNPDGNRPMSKVSDIMWNRARRPIITNEHARIFNHVIANASFRNYFLNRFADLMNTTFKRDTFEQHAQVMQSEIEAALPKHQQRWGGNMQSFYNTIDSMLQFVEQRPEYVYQQALSEFNLNKTEEITLKVLPEGAGKIIINTITPSELPWKGTYFDGVPVILKAVAAPGYEFDLWKSNALINALSLDSISVNLSLSDTFTAIFKQESPLATKSVAEKNTTPFQIISNADAWVVISQSEAQITTTLYDILGKKCFEIMGQKSLHIPKTSLAKGVYMIQTTIGRDRIIKRIIKEN